MLESVKITRRQSEIRQTLAELVGKETPTDDETRNMDAMDAEYRRNETRYRAALIAEDDERRDAKGELESRGENEWSELMGKFELRQVALALDEGRQLDGATAEIVSEMRSRGGYRGVPIPWEALEIRAGETIATGVPDPIRTMPIIDRLFAQSVASRMGARIINIDSGEVQWPVTTSAVAAGWAATETGAVAGPTVYATTDRPLAPDNTLGITMKVTRKAMKQTGAALEQAIRRDMNGCIGEAMDQAVFLESGASGEPLGVIAGAATYGITETALDAVATWGAFRAAVVRFMVASATPSPSNVKVLVRPEIWDGMDALLDGSGAYLGDWERMQKALGEITMSPNALAAPSGSPLESKALLTTTVGGVPPIFVGLWGGIDLIRDPYSDATSGGLRLTALTTMDLTVSRPAQLELLTDVQ